MTIRVAPAASCVNTLPLYEAIATANMRKNVPMNSTTYFRPAAPSWGWGAAVNVRPAPTGGAVTPAVAF